MLARCTHTEEGALFPSPLWGGDRGGGNHNSSGFPPSLSLPHVVSKTRLRHDGGGDARESVAFCGKVRP
jgi:hypothetical protein